MDYYLDHQNRDWPAQERFCRKLGITLCADSVEGNVFDFKRALLSCIVKPEYWKKVFPAFMEYCDCRLNMQILYGEADQVRTEKNTDLVDCILGQAEQSFLSEDPMDWPEVGGLISQKLLHLKYYEELRDPDVPDVPDAGL